MLSAPMTRFTQEHHRLRREFEEMKKLDGQNIDTRVKDSLKFQISELTEEQSVQVNVLLLDHCDTDVVFITTKSLRRALSATGRVLARAGLPEPWDYGRVKQGRMALFGRHSTLYRVVNR